MGDAIGRTKNKRTAKRDPGEPVKGHKRWLPLPYAARRGGNLRKERDDYYRHLATHPNGKEYLAGFHRPTKKTATAVWSFLKPRLKLNVERVLPPKRTRRRNDELTAKQALVIAFDAAVLVGDHGRMLTINTVFDALARHWSDHYRKAIEDGPATISYEMKADTIRASLRDLLRNGVRLEALWRLVRRGCRALYTTERIPTRGYTVIIDKASRSYAKFVQLLKADRDYKRLVHGPRLLLADEAPEPRMAREVVGEWTYNVARVRRKSRAVIERLEAARFYLDVEALTKEVDRLEQRVGELNVQLWDDYKVDVTESPVKPRGRGKRSPRQWAMKHIKVRDIPTVKRLVEEYDSKRGQFLQLQTVQEQLQTSDVARHITDGFLVLLCQ
jgi:hypothetical protein